ncbi:MAG: HIT family protein [Candidatus Shapirobacteria bacterium]|nr:HIT family protein [Candidatus Shapirobacteria bacterium]
MGDCIFCKIIAGEIPCYKVYEDDLFLAFLDINPLNLGHTLLVPKQHFNWVDEVEPYDQYWQIARKLSLAIQKATQSILVSKIVYGLGVSHAHIHLVPKYEKDDHIGGIHPNNIKKISSAEMTQIAKKINESLSSQISVLSHDQP